MEGVTKKLKKRQKLCHNCEGSTDFDGIICPFCAADLRTEKPEQGRTSFHSSQKYFQDQQTAQSLYPSAFPISSQEPNIESTPSIQPEEDSNRGFLPIFFFSLGVQLTLMGLLMLLFSHNGMITIRWDANRWILYCLTGSPFIYFGYRAISKL